MKQRPSAIIATIVVIIGLVLANFIIQIGVDPSYRSMGTDSGTFAYCGQVIADGGLMYRDCWDNKPPGVYYLNAAAIRLGGANIFAVWLFQAVWLTAAVIAFFFILDNIWQHKGLAAFGAFGMLFFVLFPGIFQGGNFTETYDLLPVVLALGAFWAYLRSGRRVWLVALGVLMAAGILLKPTYFAVELAATLVIAYLGVRRREYKRLVADIAVIMISAAIPLAMVGMYWVLQGDLSDLLFAVFTHNLTYVEQGFSLTSLYGTARMFLIQQPVSALTILAAITAGIYIYENWKLVFSLKQPDQDRFAGFTPGKMDRPQALTWYMGGVFVSLIIDVILLASSGRNFGHYQQVLIPGMLMTVIYLLDFLRRSFRETQSTRALQIALACAILALLIPAGMEIIAKEWPSINELKAFVSNPELTQNHMDDLDQYIVDNSTFSDPVLVWASHPDMNFVTQRRSPTKYIFLHHLFTPVPGAANGFDQFMHELTNDPPRLIVIERWVSGGLPSFEEPLGKLCADCKSIDKEGMIEFKQFVEENYSVMFTYGDWEVYQRIK